MFIKAVHPCTFEFDSVPDQYKTHEMCDKVVSEEPFMLKYCLDRYKTQEMHNKTVDACLLALKFVPNWFVKNKMLKKRNNVVFSIDDIDLDDIEFNNVTFFSDDMDIATIYLTNINLNDDDFNEDVILKILFLLDL